MCLYRKTKGKSEVPSCRFCLFDSGDVWQLFHLSPKYPGMKMSSAWLLNQINESAMY